MGSSSKTTNSTAQQNTATNSTTTPVLTPGVASSLSNYNQMVQNIAATPASSYVTGPSALQTTAYGTAANLQGANDPSYTAAAADETSPSASLTPDSIQSFMNPYLSNQVAATQANYELNQGQTEAANEAKAAMTNAFGGSRYGVQEGVEQATAATQQSAVIANLEAQGYTSAEAAALASAQLTQSAGTNLASIAAAKNSAGVQTAASQLAAGQDQRSIAQSQATAPISLAQAVGSLNEMGQFGLQTGSSTSGTGSANSTASSTTTSDPSILSDIGQGLTDAGDIAGAVTGANAGQTSLAKLFQAS